MTLRIELPDDHWDAIIRAASTTEIAPLSLAQGILSAWAVDWIGREAVEKGDEP